MITPRFVMRADQAPRPPHVRPMGCEHWGNGYGRAAARPPRYVIEPVPLRDKVGLWLTVSVIVAVEVAAVFSAVRGLLR